MSLNEKARGTIAGYNMLTAGGSVAAGVSGGADSVAMLHFLAGLRGEYGMTLTALHLNHKLRGDESERDEAFVRKLAEDLGVELVAEAADVYGLAKATGMSLEETGRKARYEFFIREAKRRKAKIATAHTLNDSVETVILNLARGTDLRGLCGIAPVRPSISGDAGSPLVIRPLIGCGRGEVESYCEENGLRYVTDSSNASDDFSRNRLRHRVLPVLLDINPGLYQTAAANIEARAADADCLDGLAEDLLREITLSQGRFSRDKYLSGHQAIRCRVLLSLLSQSGVAADSRRLSRLDGIVEAGGGAEQLLQGLYFKSDKLFFTIGAPAPEERAESFCMPVKIPQASATEIIDVFSDKKLKLMNTDYEHYEENIKYDPSLLKKSLDCGKIVGNLILRGRYSSDKMRVLGRGCTKSLKKLYSEAKIPVSGRDKILVLADERGPVWAEGFGVCERAAVAGETKEVLILDIIKGDVCND